MSDKPEPLDLDLMRKASVEWNANALYAAVLLLITEVERLRQQIATANPSGKNDH